MYAERSPEQFFAVRCEWATTGASGRWHQGAVGQRTRRPPFGAVRVRRQPRPALPILPPPPPPFAPPGCDSVALALGPGYQDSPSAAFMLNLTLGSAAGMLLPSGEHAVPAFFLGK